MLITADTPQIAPTAKRAAPELGAAALLIGFTAVVAQILLLRELLVVCSGNEMSLGLMLAIWLLWSGFGSSVMGRLESRSTQPRSVMAALQMAIAIVLPLTILLVRGSRGLVHALPGETLGPGTMLLISLAVLAVFGLISGWSFAAGARLWAEETGASGAAAGGAVYLMEAMGSAIGGAVASVVFVQFLSAMEIAALVGVLNCAAAIALLWKRAPRRVAAGVLLAALLVVAARSLESASLARLWTGFRLVAARNSPYGNLVVVEGEGSRTLYESGLPMFTVPDPTAAEEAVHFALLEHPAPQRVLLISGGVNGSIAEILKHPGIAGVDYVELDPAVLAIGRQYFPEAWRVSVADPRVRTLNMDGRLFLKTTRSTYDVVIANLPDPQTAQLNRFYTAEFFRVAAARLNRPGVLALAVRGSENYISAEAADFLRCLRRTLGEVFPEVIVIPGDTIHLLASNTAGTFSAEPGLLGERLRTRGVHTSYVSASFLPFRMSGERMQEIELQTRPLASTAVNRDFAPLAYYFDVALWSGEYGQTYRRAFHVLAQISYRRLAILSLLALAGVAALLWVMAAVPQQRARASSALCVAAMGFTLMALEISLLLAFQAIYGYVYRQLAIVIAAFMVGMALGSRRALVASRQRELRALTLLQAIAAISPLLLYVCFVSLARVGSAMGLQLVAEIGFPALALACGFLGGFQFPLACRVFMADGAARAGTFYALDLAGACVGALLVSAYLIPVFGFARTGWLIAAANLVPAALVWLASAAAPLPR